MTTLQQLDGTYVIDPAHSQLGFVARHAMVTKVRGTFSEFEGTATTGPDLQGAQIELTAQVASVDTRNADRDGHLKTGDFFEVETFPTLTFRSTAVEAADADTLRVTGDLTVKDVTKPVTIDFEFNGAATDPFGASRVGFSATTEISRKEFGLTWNAALEAGGVLVSDEVKILIEAEFTAPAAA